MEATARRVRTSLFLIATTVVALANLKNSQRRQRLKKKWHLAKGRILQSTVICGVFVIEAIRLVKTFTPQLENSQPRHLTASDFRVNAF